jgi:hypothetical protein
MKGYGTNGPQSKKRWEMSTSFLISPRRPSDIIPSVGYVIDITLLPSRYPRCPSVARVSWITTEVKQGNIYYTHQGEYETGQCQNTPFGPSPLLDISPRDVI